MENDELKRLLQIAMQDIEKAENCSLCKYYSKNDPICKTAVNCFVWRYADEALKLIGNE